MAEPQNDRHTPERYEETTDPRNPPNSVVNDGVRSAALRSYLGPIVVLFVVVGIALLYWANRSPVIPDVDDRQQIGTSGADSDSHDVIGERGNRDDTPGGFDPDPRPGSTAEEIESRSGNPDQPAFPGTQRGADLTTLAMLEGEPKDLVGRRVTFRNVTVADAQDASHFWIQDGNAKAEVMAPRGGPAVKTGASINVTGVVEEDGRDGVRIKAERVEANQGR
jgi:hypothetical protein